MRYSDAYVQLLIVGAFAGKIDPWAEVGRYFQQIHAGMIGIMLEKLRVPLMQRGYIAGREASLLIAEQHEPDVHIAGINPTQTPPNLNWDYVAAAEAVRVEPGIEVELEDADQHALYIKTLDSGNLVTVVEIVSPNNKTALDDIQRYESKRRTLVHEKGVHLVEIDITRSVKRLIPKNTAADAYHIAIHLPRTAARIIPMPFGEALKSFALPLRQEVLVVETQAIYTEAYQQASIAAQIRSEGRYNRDDLPFPSLLMSIQRDESLENVMTWLKALETLAYEP
jgi:hypothetical protein